MCVVNGAARHNANPLDGLLVARDKRPGFGVARSTSGR
jgi:hypothetical protein